MTNKIEATYDGQVTYLDERHKLEPHNTWVQVQAVKIRLALRKKKPVLTNDASQKPREHADVSEILDHYLFW